MKRMPKVGGQHRRCLFFPNHSVQLITLHFLLHVSALRSSATRNLTPFPSTKKPPLASSATSPRHLAFLRILLWCKHCLRHNSLGFVLLYQSRAQLFPHVTINTLGHGVRPPLLVARFRAREQTVRLRLQASFEVEEGSELAGHGFFVHKSMLFRGMNGRFVRRRGLVPFSLSALLFGFQQEHFVSKQNELSCWLAKRESKEGSTHLCFRSSSR